MLNRWFKLPALLTTALLAGTLLSACSNDTTLGSKTLTEEQSFEIRVPNLLPGVVIPLSIPVPIDLASQEGYDEDDFNFITSVTAREITFDVNPESNSAPFDPNDDGNLDTFEFVSSLTLSLKAVVDGVEKIVEVATLPMNDPQIASNTTTLSLNVQEVDIRDLIEAPEGCILIIDIAGTTPPDFIKIDAKIRFKVGLGIRS